jgi:hypothetical protein
MVISQDTFKCESCPPGDGSTPGIMIAAADFNALSVQLVQGILC